MCSSRNVCCFLSGTIDKVKCQLLLWGIVFKNADQYRLDLFWFWYSQWGKTEACRIFTDKANCVCVCVCVCVWGGVGGLLSVRKCTIIIIGIQPLGRSRQRPELSQATGMALVRCILGKFLGVVCHCFPPKKVYYPRIYPNESFWNKTWLGND